MITVLLTSAGVLGLLAFFEPCTIATHTLFSARAHREPRADCCTALVFIWISRSLLVTTLLVVAVALTQPFEWSNATSSAMLAGIATLYLVSRLIYIPVPHLEFYRLIPGSKRLPQAIRLGLTLPACTIPLFLVIVAIAINVDSLWLSLLAGLLFAALFTLPVVVTAWLGLKNDGQDFMVKAANAAPYLTAVLLFGAALYILSPSVDLGNKELQALLVKPGGIGIGLAFLAGFVFSFNPVSLASIPVVLAYITKAHEERRALLMGGAFIIGMTITHVALGAVAALGGDWVKELMGRAWGLFLGPLLIALGLMWPGWLKLRLPWLSVRGSKVTGVWGAFLLGIPFTVAICPFCAPALLVALTASAAIGSVVYGIVLLLAFSLGRSIPILIGVWSMGWVESLRILSTHQRAFEATGGIVLILSGLYLLYDYFFTNMV